MRRVLASALLGGLLWATTAASAPTAALGPQLRGPASVTPGQMVGFRAHGFRPGSLLEVLRVPVDKPSCCAVRIASSFPVSSRGDASLTFRMPRYYRRCLAVGHCRKVHWSGRESVAVTAFGYLQEATTRTSVAP